MRPNIPERLSERIDEVFEKEGYASKTEFVNDAVRRRLEEVENGSKK